MRGVIWMLALGGVAILAAGALGAWHHAGNTFAVLRWQAAVGVAVLTCALIGLGARRAAWMLLPAALALAEAGWAWFQPQPRPEAPWIVYQKNLSFRLRDPAPLIADIRAAAPDVLTLQEVTPRNGAVLRGVADLLPTQHWCPSPGVSGPAIATHWPAVPGTGICHDHQGFAALKVMSPDGPLWLVSLHLSWPWPYVHWKHMPLILNALASLDAPIVIGGDFNMVPWAHRNKKVAEVSGTERIGRALNTFPRFGPLFPLPIDHVYGPGDATGRADLRPLLGSDHRGVLAQIDR